MVEKKIPKTSLRSDILHAKNFKVLQHMLSWDALKKLKKNCLNKKSGASIKFSHFFQKNGNNKARV